jgi:hypothetical protein
MPKRQLRKGGALNQVPTTNHIPSQHVPSNHTTSANIPKLPPNPMKQSTPSTSATPSNSATPSTSVTPSTSSDMLSTISSIVPQEYYIYIAAGVFITVLCIIMYVAYSGMNTGPKSDKDKVVPAPTPSPAPAPAAPPAAPADPAPIPSAPTPSTPTAPTAPTAPTEPADPAQATEPFINYIIDTMRGIFEPGRPDINESDRNKLLPGYFNVGIEYNETV